MSRGRTDEQQTELFPATTSPPGSVRAGSAAATAGHPDQPARDAIRTRLDTNVLVEAGAGAGKTHEMVGRMVALVRDGRSVEQIAAVTFTRKAAAELRERFQTSIEKALAEARAAGDEDGAGRLDLALRSIDRATIGTIHSFCARMLRERPLEAGVDPGFREVMEADAARLTRTFWRTWVERSAAEGDARLAELEDAGIAPDELFDLFQTLVGHPDVEFPASPSPRPDPGSARAALETLLEDALRALPEREPDAGWDTLQSKVRALSFTRRDWGDELQLLDAVSTFCASDPRAVQKRWLDPAAAKALQERARAFRDGEGAALLQAWREHRYPLALDYARSAAGSFEAMRRREGTLFFQDLLLLAARLLRARPVARRELGDRYRYILVDEFQDTDPIQAEVLLLLASEPNGEDWHDAVPRPGALFVVGDPKQSIYRFRRADISIYNQVKRRFREFGMVVELTMNFRSTKTIERLVNRAFAELLPAAADEHQAAFAGMNTVRDAPGSRIRRYALTGPTQPVLRADESAQLAAWIRQRVDAGDAQPGDFLVLVRRNMELSPIAAAIEAVDLPVDVTGAGLSIRDEVEELRLLLRALADPGNAVLTVAVLVGRFYGLDFEQLAAYVLDQDHRIRMGRPPEGATGPVADALHELHALWELARRQPADVVVDHLVDRFGLLPYAAAGELGGSRAGALLYVVEAVRAAALAGDASLRGALDAIEATLEAKEAEAPLEPGREDAVRVMNLHQAKGLEAEIVVLAAPRGQRVYPPERHIARSERGPAQGYVLVARKVERGAEVRLAMPPGWDAHAAEEAAYELAEQKRLLYVAATRAKRELVVGCCSSQKSPWAELEPYLRDAETVVLPAPAPAAASPLPATAEEISEELERVAAERTLRARPGYHAAPVTDRVKPEPSQPAVREAYAGERIRGRGPDWGRALHGTLEAAARGASGERLRRIGRDLLIAAERPSGPDGEPEELDDALAVVEAVTHSELWQRAHRADRMLAEVPFALALDRAEYEAAVGGVVERAGPYPEEAVPDMDREAPVQLVEGVVDLAFREGESWTIVDYKTDVAGASIDAERKAKYRSQVGLYAEAWQRLTGEPVRERVILFTATGEVESW